MHDQDGLLAQARKGERLGDAGHPFEQPIGVLLGEGVHPGIIHKWREPPVVGPSGAA